MMVIPAKVKTSDSTIPTANARISVWNSSPNKTNITEMTKAVCNVFEYQTYQRYPWALQENDKDLDESKEDATIVVN